MTIFDPTAVADRTVVKIGRSPVTEWTCSFGDWLGLME
jgi:hypothetical protein